MAIDAFENGTLGLGMLDKLLSHSQGSLAQLLLCIELARVGLLDQEDGSISAFTQATMRFEICSLHLAENTSIKERVLPREPLILFRNIRADEVMLEWDFVACSLSGVIIAVCGGGHAFTACARRQLAFAT